MAQRIDIVSISPYFDDYDPDKDYLRVLFRPGYPIQARELSTLQSALQEQVARFGDNIYNNGRIITDGEFDINRRAVRLSLTGAINLEFPPTSALANTTLATISQLEGLIITDSTRRLKARVLTQPVGTSGTAQVGNLFVEYLTNEIFPLTGGFIYALSEDNPSLTTSYYSTFNDQNQSTLMDINSGVIYVKGQFVRLAKQSVIIDPNSSEPVAQIGFTANETIVTQNDDSTLFDNARGTTNEGAPGAHRLRLDVSIAIRPINAEPDPDFYQLTVLNQGVETLDNFVDDTYGELIDIMARRTYDESGNYSVRPFLPNIIANDDPGTFTLNISPSKAYVQGYEIDKRNPAKIQIPSILDTFRSRNHGLSFVGTTSIQVDDATIAGVLPGQEGGGANPYDPANRLLLQNADGVIGVARGYAVDGLTVNGANTTQLYLYDIKMFQVIRLENAAGLTIQDTTGTVVTPDFNNGHFVYSNNSSGYLYTDETTVDTQIPGTGLAMTLVNHTGTFRAGRTATTDFIADMPAIQASYSYDLSEVTSITAATAAVPATFMANATIVDGSAVIRNSNSRLFNVIDRHVASLNDDTGAPFDNDYTLISPLTSAATTLVAQNGNWDSVRRNDVTQSNKTLNFGYLRVSNLPVNDNRAAFNSGWLASDRQVSLFYPDINEVYGISESTDFDFDNADFATLEIQSTGTIPQGSIITGNTSGTQAIVALGNGAEDLNNLTDDATIHSTISGTGENRRIEIVYRTGLAFEANEVLTVEVPGGQTEFNSVASVISTTAAVGSDISGLFQFDNGQKNEYYDVGRLVRRANAPAPSGSMVVFFSYWTDNAADVSYYSVDSYAQAGFYREDVRYYDDLRPILPKSDNSGIDLRNAIDFRFKVQPVTTVADSPFTFSYRTFAQDDRARILPNSLFTTDYNYYLGRIDKVSLDPDGIYIVERGVPSQSPTRPLGTVEGMDLFYLGIPPAVRYPETEVSIDLVDNRRYTMRDIGTIEKRVDRLETAVALSLLESQALVDDVEGRTKIGFVVDDFAYDGANSDSPADINHNEFNASVDVLARQLIPGQTDGVPVDVNISSQTGTSDFFPGYIMRGFTEEVMVENTDATSAQVVTPTPAITYIGTAEIDPSEDAWRIRVDDYFTSLYGQLSPFSGNAADFGNFQTITSASPGGMSRTMVTWTGGEITTREFLDYQNACEAAPPGVYSYSYMCYPPTVTETTTAAKTKISTITRTFDSPRVVDGGAPITTHTGSTVVEDPSQYWMRSVTVNFSCAGLRPNSAHTFFFGGDKITGIDDINTDENGMLSGSFTIPAMTFKAGVEVFEVRAVENPLNSFATAQFTSRGYRDIYETTIPVTNETSVIEREEIPETVVPVSTRHPDAPPGFMNPPGSPNITADTGVIRGGDTRDTYWFVRPDELEER